MAYLSELRFKIMKKFNNKKLTIYLFHKCIHIYIKYTENTCVNAHYSYNKYMEFNIDLVDGKILNILLCEH